MSATAHLAPLYREAARATAAGSKSFYFATRFFPPHLAQSAHAVYWFCRYTDDLVDEAASPQSAAVALESWARDLDRVLHGAPAAHPALTLFHAAIERHAIPHEYPLELIEGMRMDLRCQRYTTFAELRQFCYRVASVVGLMMSHVIGFQDPAKDHAIDLGIAMQLTNILRDIGEDLARGRVYLPLEELERYGYTLQDLFGQKRSAAFVELMRFQIRRARLYYAQARPGIPLLHADGRFAVQIAADVYERILARIEAADYDVFTTRAYVPAHTKYWLTAKSMALPAARHSLLRLAFWRG